MSAGSEKEAANRVIYTIGHSNHPIEYFLELLQAYEIESVVDVRRFPFSRRNPQFNRDRLAASLQETNINYVWMGEALGGFRSGSHDEHMRSDVFEAGVEHLKQHSAARRTAFMCSERLFTNCHRRFIADELSRDGWHVLHIVEQGEVYEHQGALL